MKVLLTTTIAGLAVMAILTAGCGGGSPSVPPIPTTTITINGNGRVTPADIQIARGSRVTFVNQHGSPHDMTSDPHPTHVNCPEINQVGNLFSGQSRQTGAFNTARRCGFHDHGEPTNDGLQGSITIQ
jgi:plastocyanin